MYEAYALWLLVLGFVSLAFTIWVISSIQTLKKQVKLIMKIQELDIKEELEEEEG